MKQYRTPQIRRLSEFLREAPAERRLAVIDRAERFVTGSDRQQEWTVRDISTHLACATDALPKPDRAIGGDDVRHDLAALIEDVSKTVALPADEQVERILTVADVGKQLNVSTKTVDRWRRRGLVGRWYRFGNRKQLGFAESTLKRFVAQNTQMVRRGAQFSQMTTADRRDIINGARELAAAGRGLAQITSELAERFDRSVETIRYTIRQHDQQHPNSAVLGDDGQPSPERAAEIYDRRQNGAELDALAREYGANRKELKRLLHRERVARLLEQPIEFIDSAEFDDPDASEKILGPAPETPRPKGRLKPPSGLPPYLASLYEVPLLTQPQEAHYFRKMNFLKRRAEELRRQFDPRRVKAKDLDRLEGLLNEAAQIKNVLIRTNLRLVVSIAKKYTRPDSNFFEIVSDGNVSLMRAIDKFDYSRGFKFSTYATWAIRRNFARSIPAEYTHLGRFRTGNDELFHQSRDSRSSQFAEERTNREQHQALARILQRLQTRDRKIISLRYGLEEGVEPQTLEEVGVRFGVTKERVRQLESRALRKLREIAAQEKLDVPGI